MQSLSMMWRGVVLFTLVFASVAACAEETSPPESTDPPMVRSELTRNLTPAAVPADVAAVARDGYAVDLDLYRVLGTTEDNFLVSSLSIRLAFALAYAGAVGDTATEMAQVLRFGADPTAFHSAMNALDLALAARNLPAAGEQGAVELMMVNTFWGQEGRAWLPAYLDVIAVNYGAGIAPIDFKVDPDAARQRINTQVAQETRQRIQNLLPEGSITTDTEAVLTNTLFLKAPWKELFDPEGTGPAPFVRLDGSTVTADFMNALHFVGYAEGPGWQAMAKPLRGGQLQMVFLMPTEDFLAFAAALTAEQIASVLGALTTREVMLSVPKFTFETSFSLKSALEALGMTVPFSDLADFSAMLVAPPLFISNAFHKTFIAVDEGGVEAAAATAVVMDGRGIPEPEAVFVAERPFFFMIHDSESGAVLFFGQVIDPTA